MTAFIYHDFRMNLTNDEFTAFVKNLMKVRQVKVVYNIEENCLEIITTKN